MFSDDDTKETFSPSDRRYFERGGRQEKKERPEKKQKVAKEKRDLLKLQMQLEKKDSKTFGTKTREQEAREQVLNAKMKPDQEKMITDAERQQEAQKQFPESQQQVG